MITRTKSDNWADELFQNVDKLKSGDKDISWIFEFLGWGKYGKRTGRGTKSHW